MNIESELIHEVHDLDLIAIYTAYYDKSEGTINDVKFKVFIKDCQLNDGNNAEVTEIISDVIYQDIEEGIYSEIAEMVSRNKE